MTMISSRLVSFLTFLVILIYQAYSLPVLRYYYCFNNKGNYTANSAYNTNLKTLLSNLTSNTEIDYGFYNSSYGQNSDKASAIGLCRGDQKPDDCGVCLNNATIVLPQLCPNQKEAIVFYDECMLRYSNRSIFGVLESDFSLYLWNVRDVPDKDKYNQVVRELLERLRSKAIAGDSRRKFAAANETGPVFQTIYGIVQCTPDLSEKECNDCLTKAISEIPKCCEEKRGGRVLKPSCNIRYEGNRFYDLAADLQAPASAPALPPQESPPTLPPQSTNTNSSKGRSNTLRTVIVIVVPIVAFGVLFIFIFIYFRMRKQKKTIDSDTEDDDKIKTIKSLQLDFETIKVATNNFSDANKLGQGGFGPVYKGRLSSGQEVAVKSQGNTSRIIGTFGYIAPEYASRGQFSIKSDVYSFGVLVLEIVSGQKVNSNLGENGEDLLSFAWKNWRDRTAFKIVDPELNNGSRDEIMRCIHMGLLCVQENVADRPTIASVLLMLNSYSVTLPVPLQPPSFMNSRSLPEMQSWERSSGTTRTREPENNSVQPSEIEASITELYPR
ncbi:hypothetical protein L6164_035822 [Bauhinia variegata]|uniref:Uncharacterized protein n=1 Tax=Bauhinia variegata TaxID=167791 RepID=A0ACB9KFE5_BAUVA|nr:hypothetical protein L6164_035822 [Bauhinia variegata]